MSTNVVVRARIDGHIKEEASAVLAAMGLTISDAFRIMLTRVAHEKALPFEPLVPNATTIEVMKEARRCGLKPFATVEDLMTDLNADDSTDWPIQARLQARSQRPASADADHRFHRHHHGLGQ